MDFEYDAVIFFAPDIVKFTERQKKDGADMKIVKVINNNVVSSMDNQQREIIVLGKGIGFRKSSGDEIQEERVEKIFQLSTAVNSQFERLVSEIPYEYIKYTDEIVKEAGKVLGSQLNRNIYITLTDHLHFAIERHRKNILFQNALLWEIKKFYSREFAVGQYAAAMIKEKEGIELSEDEAGFIAIHIVNAEMDGGMEQTANAPEMLQDMLNIVKYTFHIALDEESLSYELYRRKCPKAYACAKKIRRYMEEKTETLVTDEEVMYLTVHISRVIDRNHEQ